MSLITSVKTLKVNHSLINQINTFKRLRGLYMCKIIKMNYFAHETAIIDEGCKIGEGTKIWHFSHIMPGCNICNIYSDI